MEKMDLQRFAEGEATAAAAAGAPGGTGEAAQTAETTGTGTGSNGPVRYGKQPGMISTQQQAQPAQQTGSDGETFEQLIKGRYKDDYQRAVQSAVQERYKTANADRQKFADAQPIIRAMAAKYGVDPNDLKGIADRINDDDAMYMDEAAKAGMPVKQYKAMRQLELQNQELRAREQQTAEDRALRQHFANLTQQAEAMQTIVPGFDLGTEMQNPAFARLTAPGSGVSLQDAYFAVHREEIMQQRQQQAAREAASAITKSVASGLARPSENGIGQPGGSQVKSNPATWDRNDLAEVARRVRAGEKIYL